jgi:small-conductance mechanosensitive channel
MLCLALPAMGAVEPASLMLDGQTLFEFKVRLGSIAPADRVKLIEVRLNRLLDEPGFDLNSLSVQEDKEVGWKIYAADTLLLVITPEDAKSAKQSGKLIAEGISYRIKEIILKNRHERSPKEFLKHTIYAVAYTLGLFLILFLMAFIHRRISKKIQSWQESRVLSLRIKTMEVLPADRIAQMLRFLIGVTRFLFTLALLYFYVPLVLHLFPVTAPYSALLLGYVSNPVKQIFTGIVDFIPNLFFIVITLVITRYVLKFVRVFFNEIEKGTLHFAGFYPEWGQPTYQLVRMFAIAFSLVIIFPYIPGSKSAAFQGVSVFIGVLVSFGSSSAVSNVIAGLVLTYMRSFRIGDRVKIADTTGDVVEKTLLITRIQTVKNVEVTVPNSLVLGSHIVNFSTSAKTKGLILHTQVTIGYDAPWKSSA